MSLITIFLVAASAFAANGARRCPDGTAPFLTGDALTSLACPGRAAGAAPRFDGPPIEPNSVSFSALEGRWESSFTRGTGRYGATITIKKTAAGAEVVLEAKELQMRDISRLRAVFTVLSPGKYRVTLFSPEMPGSTLSGTALFRRLKPSTAVIAATKDSTASNRAEIVFDNGAAHRLAFMDAKTRSEPLQLSIESALPGAAIMRYGAALTRAPDKKTP